MRKPGEAPLSPGASKDLLGESEVVNEVAVSTALQISVVDVVGAARVFAGFSVWTSKEGYLN